MAQEIETLDFEPEVLDFEPEVQVPAGTSSEIETIDFEPEVASKADDPNPLSGDTPEGRAWLATAKKGPGKTEEKGTQDTRLDELEEFANIRGDKELLEKISEIRSRRDIKDRSLEDINKEVIRAARTNGGELTTPGDIGASEIDELYAPIEARKARDAERAKDYTFYVGGIDENGVRAENAGVPENFIPSSDMYEGVSQPEELYKYLEKSATGRTIFGEPTFNNKIIPKPGEYGMSPSVSGLDNINIPTIAIPGVALTPKISSLVEDAFRESGKNALMAITAIADRIAGTDMTSSVKEGIADPPKAGAMDALIKDGMKYTAAAYAGAKSAKQVGEVTKAYSKFLGSILSSGLMQGIAGTAAAVAVTGEEDSTLLTGKDAMLPLIPGDVLKKDGRVSTEVLNNRLNHLIDAVATVGPALAVSEAATAVVRFMDKAYFSRLKPLFSEKASELMAARSIAKSLFGKEEVSKEDLELAARYVKEHATEKFVLEDGTEATIKRTPMSAIAEGAVRENNPTLEQSAINLDKKAMDLKIPEVQNLKRQPKEAFDQAQGQLIENRGGEESIGTFRDTVADEAIGTLRKADEVESTAAREVAERRAATELEGDIQVAGAEDVVREMSEELFNLYRTDETFGETIYEMSKKSGVDIAGRLRTKQAEKVLPELVNGIKQIGDESNRLYDAISPDAKANAVSFAETLREAMNAGALSSDVQKVLRKFYNPETKKFEGLTFRALHNEILPHLNKDLAMEYLQKGGADRVKIQALEGMVSNIKFDQLEYIAKRYPSEAEKALRARNYYRDTVSKYKNQQGSPISALWRAYDQSFFDHHAVKNAEGDIVDLGANISVKSQAQDVAEAGISDDIAFSDQVLDLLQQPEYRGDRKGLLNIWKGEIADEISKKLRDNGGDLSKIEASDFYKAMDDKGVPFKRRPEYATDIAEIETFINNIKVKKMSLKQAEDYLDRAKKARDEALKAMDIEGKGIMEGAKAEADALRAKVDHTVLKEFIEKVGIEVKPKENVYAVMKKILSTDNNEGKLRDLVKVVRESGDENAQRGLEALYIRNLSDKLTSVSNNEKLNLSQVRRLQSDDLASWEKYGEIIFEGSNKDLLPVLRDFVGAVATEQTKMRNSITLGSSGEDLDKMAKEAMGALINIVIGPLSRTGAKTGAAGRGIINLRNPHADFTEALSEGLSTDEGALRLFDRLKELHDKEPTIFHRFATIASVMNGKENAGEGFKEALEEVLDYVGLPVEDPETKGINIKGMRVPEAVLDSKKNK